MTRRGVAAVVVNYRTPARTLTAVAALLRSTPPPIALRVVDNGGHDAATLAAALPPGALLVTERNLGFAGGANRGIAAALETGAEAVAVVNSDAEVAPGCLGLLLSAVRTPCVGLAGPALLRADDRDRLEALGLAPAPRTGRFRCLEAGRLLPAHAASSAPRQVAALPGTVLVIRREVLERVGGFDETFFLYLEDVELCLRAGAAGFRSVVVPAARAWHVGRASAGDDGPGPLYYATRNQLRLKVGAGSGSWLRPGAIVGANLLYALRGASGPRARGLREVLRGALDYARGRTGPGGGAVARRLPGPTGQRSRTE